MVIDSLTNKLYYSNFTSATLAIWRYLEQRRRLTIHQKIHVFIASKRLGFAQKLTSLPFLCCGHTICLKIQLGQFVNFYEDPQFVGM